MKTLESSREIKTTISKTWIVFLFVTLLVGLLLRVLFVEDMEYKEDEEYNFTQSQAIGNTLPWPWFGIPSGVYLVNPGMSIWVFAFLAKMFGIHQPTALANAVQLFAFVGMSLIIPFVLKVVEKEDRKDWLWALALAMVNPFLVFYQRKLWPEPFLPFFTMLTLLGWWRKETRWGAFLWGMVGAWLGQIHMSGFFFSFALFLWTGWIWLRSPRPQTLGYWNFWFLGSVVGALPLIPWLIYVIQHPFGQSMSTGWEEIIQLKYWAFWFTDPLGLHLGNPLGLLRGQSHLSQISDFIRYPIFGGTPTYLNGLAHFITLVCAAVIFSRACKGLWEEFWIHRSHMSSKIWSKILGSSSNTALVQNSALFGCGILLTLTGVMIRRYYMNVTFPLEFIFLVRMAQSQTKWGSRLLATLWVCELFISINFVGYIHVNEGAIQGDYGRAYHLIQKDLIRKNQKQ